MKLIILLMLVIMIGGAAHASTLTDGLDLYMSLEDNAANTNVDDDRDNYSITASTNTNDLSVSGKISNALDFDSLSSQYMYGNTDWSAPKNGTINFWYYADSADDAQIIYYYYVDAVNRFRLQTNGGNYVLYYNDDDDIVMNQANTGHAINVGTWEMLTIRKNDTDIAFFANGVQTFNKTTSKWFHLLGSGESGWCSFEKTSNFCDGAIDEWGYWSRNLSNDDISSLWAGGDGKDLGAVINETVNIAYCNSTYSDKVLNFTVRDSETDIMIDSYNFYATFTIWDIDFTTDIYTRSIENESSVNYTQLCIPSTEEYAGDYEVLFTATGYEEYHMIVNNDTELKAPPQTLNILMQDSSVSTAITVTLVDEVDEKLSDYIVEAYRYDLGSNSYNLVDSLQTGNDGSVQFNLDVDTYQYKFHVLDTSNNLVYTEPKQWLTETAYTFRIPIEDVGGFPILDVHALNITLSVDRPAQNFTVEWHDINNVANHLRMEIWTYNATVNKTLNYTYNTTDDDGSYTFYVNGTFTSQSISYIAEVWVNKTDEGKLYYIDSKSMDFKKEWDIFGEESTFMTFLVVGTLMFVGASMGIEAMALLSILGLFISWWAGMFKVALSAIIGLCVGLIILMVRAKQR